MYYGHFQPQSFSLVLCIHWDELTSIYLKAVQCPGRCRHLVKSERDVAKNTSKTIHNLKPYTEYSVAVQAFNTKGAGGLSEPVTVRTLEDSTYSKVSNFLVKSGGKVYSTMLTTKIIS